jgi:TRAP-type C4-dicarboxylate transport system substrate-binding protein
LKRFWIILILLTLVIISGCKKENYGLEPKPKEQIILRLADVYNTDYPSTLGGKRFTQLLEKRTNGRIKVRLFDNGELGDELSAIEQVQFGGIDLARVNAVLLFEYLKKYQVILLPGLYRDSDHLRKVLNGKIGMKIGNELLKEKIVTLCWYDTGNSGFYNTRRELTAVSDFRGMKLGVSKAQLLRDRINSLGSIPIYFEPTEVFNQLQNRTIDGAQNNLILYWLLNHYKIAKFYTSDAQTYLPDVLIGSRVAMLQLTKEDQQIIATAARDSVRFQRKAWGKATCLALAQLKRAGVKITSFEPKEQQKMVQMADSAYGNLSKEDQNLLQQIKNTH